MTALGLIIDLIIPSNNYRFEIVKMVRPALIYKKNTE